MFWNVRASPARARRAGDQPSMRCPARRTRPADGVDEPAHDVEERRLAGAVGADEPDEGALPYVERDPVERLNGAEGDADPGDVEDPAPAGWQAPAMAAGPTKRRGLSAEQCHSRAGPG